MSLFHQGELELQKRLGSKVDGEKAKRILLPELLPQAINFITNQECVYLSTIDNKGDLWISPLIGKGLFLVLSTKIMVLRLDQLLLPLKLEQLVKPFLVGFLFIDTVNRRRYRVNGMAHVEENKLEVEVLEAYTNCPKYIQARSTSYAYNSQAHIEEGKELTESLQKLVRAADTFYVASKNASGNMDASHRGGNPGFITFNTKGQLCIPDYHGNGLFNTLGNFVTYPRAGLLFIDYETHSFVQLTGNVEVVINDENPEKRYWVFTVSKWIRTSKALTITQELFDYSPFNP